MHSTTIPLIYASRNSGSWIKISQAAWKISRQQWVRSTFEAALSNAFWILSLILSGSWNDVRDDSSTFDEKMCWPWEGMWGVFPHLWWASIVLPLVDSQRKCRPAMLCFAQMGLAQSRQTIPLWRRSHRGDRALGLMGQSWSSGSLHLHESRCQRYTIHCTPVPSAAQG